MATQYPSTLPQPLLEGFSATVDAGVIRAEMPTHQAQRRVYNTMPHTFTLAFIMSVEEWGSWYRWVNTNGFRWFDIELLTFYSGRTLSRTVGELQLFTEGIGYEKGLALNFVTNDYAVITETVVPAAYSPVTIRFTSDITASNVSATDVRVTVMAELAPSAIATWLDAT